MRSLFYPKFSLAIRTNHLCAMRTIPFLSCYYNHKIFYPVILLILDRAYRIFSSFVMNQLPRVKITTKMLCHYQTVFKNTTFTICHSIEKVIAGKTDKNISIFTNLSSALPKIISCTRWLIATASAFLAMQIYRNTPLKSNPSFLSTTHAGVPDIFIVRGFLIINSIWIYLFSSSYFSNYRHALLYHPHRKFAIGGSPSEL